MTMEAEREGEEQQRSLLSSSSSLADELLSPSGGGGGWAGGGPDASAAEVESAVSFSSSNFYPPAPEPHHDVVYPPSIHSGVLSSSPLPAPTPPHTLGLATVPQGPCPYGGDCQPSQGVRSREAEYLKSEQDVLEIRNLLIDHVGHRCCWGSRSARTWKITSIKDCIAYVGTLENFIEKRDAIIEKEPYYGRNIDGRDHGPVLGVWELDLRSDFPPPFVEKELMVKIPHSDVTEKCLDCKDHGETPCPTCNAGQQHGFYKANHMTKCSGCDGRGLLTCQDGSDESDTVCGMCNGEGMLPCTACGSRGLLTCKTCDGCGSLLAHSTARVRWKTLLARKVSVAEGAVSVPEEFFHSAKGVQLCNILAYRCTPAFFADSYPLSQFFSEVVASRLPVPPSARVISERHIILEVPVTRFTMSHRNQSFSFYVVGYNRDIFVRDYPSKFCWGLCCCFEWLGN